MLQAEEHSRATAQEDVCGTDGLPTVAVALNVVLDTAVAWAALPADRAWLSNRLLEWLEKRGRGHTVQHDTREALAVSGLRRLAASDSELFWWSCVEGLPDTVVARRLGRSPAQVSQDILRVTAEFRKHSSPAHSLRTQDSTCRTYAGLLDAAVRQRGHDMPMDLRQHVNQCSGCAEDFDFLAADNTRLPTVIAETVIRWNGSAYVADRRRELTDATAVPEEKLSKPRRTPRYRTGAFFGWGLPLWGAAGAVVGLLLVASSLELIEDNTFPRYEPPPRLMVEPEPGTSSGLPSPDVSDRSRPGAESSEGTGDVRAGKKASHPPSSTPEHSPTQRAAADYPQVKNQPSPPDCTAAFDVTNSWEGGVDANLHLSPQWAVQDWTVTFRVPEGAQVSSTWHGVHTREGNRVIVTAADYNRTSAAGATLTIGLVLRGDLADGSWLSDVRVDGRVCAL
ncbi:cellulose binding domain-containing protein [Streptomyces cyaneofuscatus]|uniref:cellulose binding domain-containing protein n=1 Tax=Streptomyces cyaneofuscatus TaxID=66883 RepID=UPI00343EA890